MTLKVVTAPNYTGSHLPVTVDELKIHSRIGTDASENLRIAGLLRAATLKAELITNRSLGGQVLRLKLNSFPYTTNNSKQTMSAPIELLQPPVTAVSLVRYRNTAGTWVTMAEDTDYELDLDSLPPRILPAYLTSWPACRDYYNSVEVNYTAGYAAGTIPEPILQAIRLMAAAWYENGEDVSDRNLETLPCSLNARALLEPYRVWRF